VHHQHAWPPVDADQPVEVEHAGNGN
jgi:hypothetical protein